MISEGQQATTAPSVIHTTTPTIHPIMTQTAALSVVVSHSPTHTQDRGGGSDGVNIDSLSVGVGVAGTSLVFVSAAVIITTLVCLRKRSNAVNTTDNVAYSSTSEIDSCINTAYVAISDHSTACNDEIYTCIPPPNSAVPTITTEAYMITDIIKSNKLSIRMELTSD